MLPMFPPDDVAVEIMIDDDGEFQVKPAKCWVAGGGTVRFRTNGTTAAQINIPDTNLLYDGAAPVPGTLDFKLGLTAEKIMTAAGGYDELPYTVYRVEGGQVESQTEQAPVIIIVKTASRTEEV